MTIAEIHACDDWLSCKLDTLDKIHTATADLQAQDMWQEVVAGLDSVAVQFDPAHIMPDEAKNLFRTQLDSLTTHAMTEAETITIPLCYDEQFAPDISWVAEKMDLSVEALIALHSSAQFTVTMLGFMPGFAYLQCHENIPAIGRLPKPRQRVAAGSIGLIGEQSCIYSFDSPGGWPIIGRTPVKLFDADRPRPALLTGSQRIAFQPISSAEFKALRDETVP
ncbi:carboxyltransferase domain-containing protein [Sphingorhabdus sp. Alg231-15]|uniref:carboxyltransferase domain-containing protein n=1 Tax=Sphingorhabdus sp. Alg231-15 TaxID=1922222 RepID=UPI000D55552A